MPSLQSQSSSQLGAQQERQQQLNEMEDQRDSARTRQDKEAAAATSESAHASAENLSLTIDIFRSKPKVMAAAKTTRISRELKDTDLTIPSITSTAVDAVNKQLLSLPYSYIVHWHYDREKIVLRYKASVVCVCVWMDIPLN